MPTPGTGSTSDARKRKAERETDQPLKVGDTVTTAEQLEALPIKAALVDCGRDKKAAEPRCEVDGCETRQYARLLCLTHYRRWNRTGSTEDRPAHRVPLPKPQPPTIANLIDGTCTICNQPDTSHGWCESRDAAICRLCEHHSCEGAK